MLGRQVRDTIKERGYGYPWGDILPAIAKADFFLVNLECVLSAQTQRWFGNEAKWYHFRADPDMVAVLRAGSVSCVSLANNHIGDFGLDGLLDTIRALDSAGISHAGAGSDLDAARAPARLIVRGRQVAVMAAADYPSPWAASIGTPGMHFLAIPPQEDELAPLLQAIATERSRADYIILSLHWGYNMCERPSAEFRSFAHRMLDAGVDLIWGHSAHLPQAVERSDQKLVLYDTGDLIDDYAVDPTLRNDLSAVFMVTLGSAGVERLEVIPIRIADRQARLARGEDAAWITNRMARLSTELATTLSREDDRLLLGAGAP
jgi:poly-gamma-glutamate synthesis protein (capsule biosynthesis protein)